MKTIGEFFGGMEVREAFEYGKMVGRLEAGNKEAEAERQKQLEEWMIEMGATKEEDARWEKHHAEVVDGFDRAIGMLEEVAEDSEKWSLDDEVWRLDGDDVVEEERVVIALPWDVAVTLMRVRAVVGEAADQ